LWLAGVLRLGRLGMFVPVFGFMLGRVFARGICGCQNLWLDEDLGLDGRGKPCDLGRLLRDRTELGLGLVDTTLETGQTGFRGQHAGFCRGSALLRQVGLASRFGGLIVGRQHDRGGLFVGRGNNRGGVVLGPPNNLRSLIAGVFDRLSQGTADVRKCLGLRLEHIRAIYVSVVDFAGFRVVGLAEHRSTSWLV
jgi:hypothetical protein